MEFYLQACIYNHNKYQCFKNEIPFEIDEKFEKSLKSRYQKCSRIKKRFVYLLSRYDYIWFCTFTFDNHYIDKTTRTKRDLIKSVINTHDFKYILNVDYGKQTEREHYHCIIATNWNMDVNQFVQSHYPCHSLSILCKKGSGDFSRLSKYINKLTNHCLKVTTKKQRILYNFKGYDNFCTSGYEKFLCYTKDKIRLFNDEITLQNLTSIDKENVGLLDKAHITGKNLTQFDTLELEDYLLPIID